MKVNILIVDDEESIRFTVKEFLLQDGYKVFTAEGYDEAIKIINTEGIDIIVSDIVLGDRSGVDILRKVSEKGMICPVILFTGQPNVETASEAVRLGAYDYVLKPLRKEALLHIVRMAFRHKCLVYEKMESHANLEAIFSSVTDAIITVDGDLKVIQMNVAAETICGFSRDEVIGKSLDSIPINCCGQCIALIKRTILERQPLEIYRAECRHKTRSEQLVSMSTFPLNSLISEISGCVIIIKDETRISNLEKELEKRQRVFDIIGKDVKMQNLYSLMENLYDIDTTVLIHGESGTGKGLVAEAIHYGGKRGKKPFVKVDCSALTETLLESELFGHIRGAFTGAVTDKVGRFKKADGGTLFLDEIGDVSLGVQQRLLRVLQDKEFERVGDSTPVTVDVRIIAATNQDIQEKIRRGTFRKDLFYRLKVVMLTLPALRDRRGDIPFLVKHFIKKFNQKFRKMITAVSSDVYKIFMDYGWPGNVRELENVLEYCFVVCSKDVITTEDLPGEYNRNMKSAPCVEGKSIEYDKILSALEQTHWNKTGAARLLGISRRTIYNKIKYYNIRQA